jgi:hypothetical protein
MTCWIFTQQKNANDNITITVVTYIYSSRGVFNKICCFYSHLGLGICNNDIFLTKDASGFYACDYVKVNKLFCIFLYSRIYIYSSHIYNTKLLVVNVYRPICIYIIALYLLLLLRFRTILHKVFKGNRLKTILTRR